MPALPGSLRAAPAAFLGEDEARVDVASLSHAPSLTLTFGVGEMKRHLTLLFKASYKSHSSRFILQLVINNHKVTCDGVIKSNSEPRPFYSPASDVVWGRQVPRGQARVLENRVWHGPQKS